MSAAGEDAAEGPVVSLLQLQQIDPLNWIEGLPRSWTCERILRQDRTLRCSVQVNPRPGRGGGVDATLPEVFLRCTPNYEADRAEILYS